MIPPKSTWDDDPDITEDDRETIFDEMQSTLGEMPE